jgi:serine/threonine-protein kinase RsbW
VIVLRVPGTLSYRNLVMRVVEASCRLGPEGGAPEPSSKEFDYHVISAFGEVFNNVVLHGYNGGPKGEIEVQIEPLADRLVLRVLDWGKSFDPTMVPPPDLEALVDSGRGVYIVQSFMDELVYEAGKPNLMILTKYRKVGSRPKTSPASSAALSGEGGKLNT